LDTFSRSVRRTIVLASQSLAWFSSQLLKLGFAIEMHHPPGFLTRGPERCLILACSHKSVFDPWLIMSALRYRQWRMLMPVRTLATQTFRGALKWFKPIIRLLYRLAGAIELPPKREGGSLPEKVQGLLDALRQGDVVAIFPEGGVWKKRNPPIGEFAPGVVYLQRQSGARIVPIAVCARNRYWRRGRCAIEIGAAVCVPERLDLEAGAAWLRGRMLELDELARRGGQPR
jgi:1-acyl-sn-glycerol-3-phosphate acyltransferase